MSLSVSLTVTLMFGMHLSREFGRVLVICHPVIPRPIARVYTVGSAIYHRTQQESIYRLIISVYTHSSQRIHEGRLTLYGILVAGQVAINGVTLDRPLHTAN